jgi:hypothetical protein
MIAAFVRLFLISVSTLIVMIFAVVMVRWMGFQQTFAPPPHPWLEQDFWRIYEPPLSELCGGKFSPADKVIVALPVERKLDQWQVPCPTPVSVREWFANSQHQDWLLELKASDTSYLDNLVEIVSSFDKQKHFGAQSSSQKVSRYLRKKAPQWLFAADSASLVRLQMFESLWIETAMDFWPDFVITTGLPERSAQELSRRKKRIIWLATSTAPKPNHTVHGIMTTRPSQ